MKIGNKTISKDQPPLIVAELSGNHGGDVKRAVAIVEKCIEAGVDAIKLQTYTADTITLDSDSPDFLIKSDTSLWKNRRMYDLYKEAFTPWEWHKEIFDIATDAGLIAFSSAFDETSVDFLESLNVPCYKVASFEITHIPLLEKIKSTGKPVVLSTGMASEEDIKNALKVFDDKSKVMLLKCTSNYPAKPEEMNLSTISDMQRKFGVEIGLSDHTIGIQIALASVALGAVMIEKHVTLEKGDQFVDSQFSLTPAEFRDLAAESKNIWMSLGKPNYGPCSPGEKDNLKFRRSVYVVKDIKSGETLTPDNLRVIRPSHGLEPGQYKSVLGKKVNRDLKAGTAFKLEYLS